MIYLQNTYESSVFLGELFSLMFILIPFSLLYGNFFSGLLWKKTRNASTC